MLSIYSNTKQNKVLRNKGQPYTDMGRLKPMQKEKKDQICKLKKYQKRTDKNILLPDKMLRKIKRKQYQNAP